MRFGSSIVGLTSNRFDPRISHQVCFRRAQSCGVIDVYEGKDHALAEQESKNTNYNHVYTNVYPSCGSWLNKSQS